MVLCMLWTEWSALSLKHLLSFLHRIVSSLCSDPVSYINSAAFSNSYSQYHSLTKCVLKLNLLLWDLTSHKFLNRFYDNKYTVPLMFIILLQCSQRLVCFRHWRNLVTWPFLLQQTLHLRSWIQQCILDYCKERHALKVSTLCILILKNYMKNYMYVILHQYMNILKMFWCIICLLL